MKRIRPVTRMPEHAASVTPDVMITIIINILEAILPLFVNKYPQGPLPPDDPPNDTNGDE